METKDAKAKAAKDKKAASGKAHTKPRASRFLRLLNSTRKSGKPVSFAWGRLASDKLPVLLISKLKPEGRRAELEHLKYRGKNRPPNCDELNYKHHTTGTLQFDGDTLLVKAKEKKAPSLLKISLRRYFHEGFGLTPVVGKVRVFKLSAKAEAGFVEETDADAEDEHEDEEGEEFPAEAEAVDAQTLNEGFEEWGGVSLLDDDEEENPDWNEAEDEAPAETEATAAPDPLPAETRVKLTDEVAALARRIVAMGQDYGLIGGLDLGAVIAKLTPWFESILTAAAKGESGPAVTARQDIAIYENSCHLLLALSRGGGETLRQFLEADTLLEHPAAEPCADDDARMRQVIETLFEAGLAQLTIRNQDRAAEGKPPFDPNSARDKWIAGFVRAHWKEGQTAMSGHMDTIKTQFYDEKLLQRDLLLKLAPVDTANPLTTIVAAWRQAHASAVSELAELKRGVEDAVQGAYGMTVAGVGGSWSMLENIFVQVNVDELAAGVAAIPADGAARREAIDTALDIVDNKSQWLATDKFVEFLDEVPFGEVTVKPGKTLSAALTAVKAQLEVLRQ